MPAIAVYARVSTQRQAQANTSEQQLERLRAYVQAQGWDLPPEHVFRDDGYSGATLRRPGLGTAPASREPASRQSEIPDRCRPCETWPKQGYFGWASTMLPARSALQSSLA